MAIPDYQTIMLPLLKFTADQKEHHVREGIEHLYQIFRLSEEEKRKRLLSGGLLFNDRVSWVSLYLRRAGLLESTRRAHYKITKRGLEALKQNPTEINNKLLQQYPEFTDWKKTPGKTKKESPTNEGKVIAEQTPAESLEYSYQKIRQELAKELLNQIKKASPSFFEKMVVDLLVKMGYGGSIKDAGEVLGKTGDGGIDGLIKEDKLGLDVIYIQAKRWDNTIVGSPELHKFIGALKIKNAHKGIFITTSDFSASALDDIKRVDIKIITIDGHRLAELMIDYNVGVSNVISYEVKKIDMDYFEET